MPSITPGNRLGPYEVVSRIGAGGMGEVFRARDTRLDRTVAIKILPAEFADNAQLKTRFEREAKAISQISHPHICALHDVGNADGVEYLVLEFLEGESLADRIARGPLPIADVIRFGSQIASALACAHRAGIVHRDVKPGNVMITKSGAKLLDFGLARSSTPASPSPTDATQHKPLTHEGTILGTFQYMSPEQLAGEEVDARSDIFALGAVLYEMLTGARAFEGKTRTSIVAAVLAGSPRPPSSLRPLTPPALEHVIARCLAREKDERWESAADLASELEWISGASSSSMSVATKPAQRRVAMLAALAIALIVILAAILGGMSVLRRLRVAEEPVRSELLTGEPLTPALFGSIALSPDGTQLMMLVGPLGRPAIAVRNLATAETKKLAGTEGAIFPFWSPDSRHIAFFAGGKLKTIGAGGGTIQTICDAKQGRGGTWSRDGVILFVPDIGAPIHKVRESGGSPVALNLDGKGPRRHPAFLPDQKRFLYVARTGDTDDLYAASIDGGVKKRIVENVSNAAFARGRLFFVRDGNLLTQPFDPAKLEVSGTPAAVADHVEYFKVRSMGNFSVTDTKLVYVGETSGLSEIGAYDRNGRVDDIPAGAADYRILDISPDDRTLAVAISEHFEQGDVWLVQLQGGAKSRFTFMDSGALSGAFSPDGTRFAMSSGFFGQTITINVRSVVSNDVQQILVTSGACVVTGWSQDGAFLVVDTQDPKKTGFDVQTIDLATKTMTPVVQGPADELAPALSPNGKWLAYVSTELGSPEVYVTAFPSGEGKWQATPDGGNAPRWSRDGKQLFYVKDDRLAAIEFHEGRVPQFGAAALLPVDVVSDRIFIGSYPGYAVTSDGRFLTTQPVTKAQPSIHLITNWSTILGR